MISKEEYQAGVNELIKLPQYSLSFSDKRKKLLELLQYPISFLWNTNRELERYLGRLNWKSANYADYSNIPYLPVSVFKNHSLALAPSKDIVRELNSSATTTGKPSRIYLDKETAFRQQRALVSILVNHLGSRKRPFLVLDDPAVNSNQGSLTARGAAIRGISTFASSVTYGLKPQSKGLEPNIEELVRFAEEVKDQEVLIFGFTFIVWSEVVMALRVARQSFSLSGASLLHSGGWKKLKEMAVSENRFKEGVTEVLGVKPGRIFDFYGMVEQVGVVYVDCESGNKHTPNFAEVLIRDPLTLDPVSIGQDGLIQVISVLPESYPGQSLMTEDLGTLLGYDDCPCGRRGMYFRFKSRVERAEIRGCGDTFAATQVIL